MGRFALVTGTLLLLGAAPAFAQSSTVTTGPNGTISGTTTLQTSDHPCRVIGSDGSQRKSDGALSSSVTAGPNGVHSSTTGAPSVTVTSHNGNSSSSSSASSSASSGGSTVVTGSGSGGDCTITVNPDRDHDSTDRGGHE